MSQLRINFIYQGTYQILLMILPLLTSPYLSRILGPDGIGEYSYTYSIASFFVLCSMLGLNNYGNREIAKNRDNPQKLNQTFSSITYIHWGASLMTTFFYIIFLKVNNGTIIEWLQLIYVLSSFFDINWFFGGIERFKIIVLKNTIIKFGTLFLIFGFVKGNNALLKYTIFMSFSIFLSQAIIWNEIKKYTKLVLVPWTQIKAHIKPMFLLFVPVIAMSLYRIIDKIMLGYLSNATQVGFYENADKLIRMPVGVITAIGTVMMPKISNYIALGTCEQGKKETDESTKVVMFLAYAMAFGLAAVASDFSVIFWGEEFAECGKLIQISASAIPFLAIADVVRSQYLIPYGKDKKYMYSITIGAVVNISLNCVLIPGKQAIGATIATVVTEMIVCLGHILVSWKNFPIILNLKKTLPFLSNAIIMFLVIKYFSSKTNISILNLLIEISLGVFIYFLLGIIVLLIIKERKAFQKNTGNTR